MIEFIKMNDNDLKKLKEFASPIWLECYDGIVKREQIELLIKKYFEYENIIRYKSEGMVYERLAFNGETAGFIAYLNYPGYVYLDKLYLLKEQRGKHISKAVFEYLIKSFGLPIRLNVNQGNKRAVGAYKANGFKVISSDEIPLEGGYVNIDYIMEKSV